MLLTSISDGSGGRVDKEIAFFVPLVSVWRQRHFVSTEAPHPGNGASDDAIRPSLVRRRLCWFRLAAILTGLLPFLLLEAALRFTDLGKPTSQHDPLAGFNRQQPLFERVGDVYQTARSREPFFCHQEFLAAKPVNGFRVFCFGGSTVYGHPYVADTGFPKWLELELAGCAPSRRIEVINCGGVSYASYRLQFIVREVLRYQPDLIVLATGENEFLEDRTYRPVKARSAFRRWLEDRAFSLRTVTLLRQVLRPVLGQTSTRPVPAAGDPPGWREVETRLDERGGYASYHRDDAWRRQVVGQFEKAMRTMIGDCRAATVPLLLVTLGSNLRDCAPYKSEHRTDLTPEEESRWQAAFEAATQVEEKDLNAALALYHQAEVIDDQYALLAYRQARCLDRLGQVDRAREYYLRAKDKDVCPLRMLEEVYQLQLAMAADTRTPLVDVRRLLESRSPHGIPGNNLYLDHVHPNIGGFQLIAQAIAWKVVEMGILPSAGPWPSEARRSVYRRQLQHLPANYFSNGRRRVEWLEDWARRQRLSGETLPKDARGFLHQGFRCLDFGDETKAWESFRTALKQDPGMARQLLDHAFNLLDQGRPESAEKLLNGLGSVVIDARMKEEINQARRRLVSERGSAGIGDSR